MGKPLPGWVVDNDTSVRAEVARYRDMTPAELWQETRRAIRGAWWAAQFGDMQAALNYQDPLPESSRAAIKRLQDQFRRECDARKR
jgi:hypothetical protein